MEAVLGSDVLRSGSESSLRGFILFLTGTLSLATAVTAAISVSFDVGYFYQVDINLFTLFSLSEHIVFSLEALPIAFLAAVSIFLLLVPALVLVRKTKNFFNQRGQLHQKEMQAILALPRNEQLAEIEKSIKKSKMKLRFTTVIYYGYSILSCLFLGVYFFYGDEFAKFTAIIGFLGLTFTVSFDKFGRYFQYLLLFFVIFVAASGLSYEIGRVDAKLYLADQNPHHQVLLKDGVKNNGLIIRSGDKGLLFYNIDNKEVTLIKWEDIKALSKIHRS